MVTGGASVGGGSRKRGVPTGSARSRSDGMGTVGIDDAAGAGAKTTDAGGRGGGARGGVIARRADGLGAPPDPKPSSTAGGAVPAAAAVRRRVLLSRYSLVLTCVVCLDVEEEQLHYFRTRWRLRPSSCLSGKLLVFRLRYAFQVLQIRSQCPNPGNYRAFNLIRSSIITFPQAVP